MNNNEITVRIGKLQNNNLDKKINSILENPTYNKIQKDLTSAVEKSSEIMENVNNNSNFFWRLFKKKESIADKVKADCLEIVQVMTSSASTLQKYVANLEDILSSVHQEITELESLYNEVVKTEDEISKAQVGSLLIHQKENYKNLILGIKTSRALIEHVKRTAPLIKKMIQTQSLNLKTNEINNSVQDILQVNKKVLNKMILITQESSYESVKRSISLLNSPLLEQKTLEKLQQSQANHNKEMAKLKLALKEKVSDFNHDSGIELIEYSSEE